MQILNWQIFSFGYRKWYYLCPLLLVVTSCNNNPPKPFSSESTPTPAIAKIMEIPNRPVWVRFINSSSDSHADVGTDLKAGESIRTEANARAEIMLGNGTIVRLEGNSNVSIDNQNQIQPHRGKIVAWTGKNITAEIVTSNAIAAISNATLYMELPKDQKDSQVLVLQGTATVRLKDRDPITLQPRQNLAIKVNGTALPPQKLSQALINQRFTQSQILTGFSTKLASQDAIIVNLQIPLAIAETVTIPYSQAPNEPQPVNNPEPYYEPSRRRADANHDNYANNTNNQNPPPEPAALPVAPAAIAEPPPEPIQPEVIPPAEPPPEPVQPEAPANP